PDLRARQADAGDRAQDAVDRQKSVDRGLVEVERLQPALHLRFVGAALYIGVANPRQRGRLARADSGIGRRRRAAIPEVGQRFDVLWFVTLVLQDHTNAILRERARRRQAAELEQRRVRPAVVPQR